MAIPRYRDRNWLSPWTEFDEMANRLNRVFAGHDATGSESVTWLPAVNVKEMPEELLLTAELPGMRKEEVEIELENNVLTIRGRKDETREEKGDRRFHVWERRYGSFQRSFTLPRTVAEDQIEATFENGVLRVHMPKAPEAKGKKIVITREA
jgi:HSP20 family protein